PRPREWAAAGAKLLIGAVLFWGAARLVPANREILLGWIGMIGLILMLHFGSFHLLSCAWRAAGVDARPLMRRPLAAESLSDFWGRRWNTAFRDLTHRFLFRPLSARLGPRWALAAGFVFSGVVHDLVISLPARGGYGGPTLFFSLQAAGLLVERSRLARALGLGRGWRGWLFTMLVLALPVGALFHPPFVRNVIVPFMRALGAARAEESNDARHADARHPAGGRRPTGRADRLVAGADPPALDDGAGRAAPPLPANVLGVWCLRRAGDHLVRLDQPVQRP